MDQEPLVYSLDSVKFHGSSTIRAFAIPNIRDTFCFRKHFVPESIQVRKTFRSENKQKRKRFFQYTINPDF